MRFAMILFAFVGVATANPPIPLDVQSVVIDGDVLVAERPVTEYRTVVEQRTVVLNGRNETVSVTKLVPVMRAFQIKYALKDVKAYDLDGLEIDPQRVPELLKSPRAVVLATTPKLDKNVRGLLKDDTIIVVLPASIKPDKPGR